MIIKINGKDETVDKPINLMELVLGKGLIPEQIVIEHNFRITPGDEWQGITLKENDTIEIVRFMGGG